MKKTLSKKEKAKLAEPSRLKYRAFVHIFHYELVKTPNIGTGGYWEEKDCMSEVLMLNLSKNTMRIRYEPGRTEDFEIHNLMQSIGKVDNSGVEIFQNDIIEHWFGQIGVVEWWRDGWYIKTQDEQYHSFQTAKHTIKVIGNTFQHPELFILK